MNMDAVCKVDSDCEDVLMYLREVSLYTVGYRRCSALHSGY